jgi:GNAT superfamily N-acetyltransferase
MTCHRVRVAALEHGDADNLFAMLGRCSPGTLYGRFHGVTDGTFYARQVLATAESKDSYVAWHGQNLVGLANLHVSDDTADIGVLIEDAWQRRGVGTALLSALVRRVRERGSRFLRADVLDDNRFVIRALSLLGSAKTAVAAGSYTTVVDLAVSAPRCQALLRAPVLPPSYPSDGGVRSGEEPRDGSCQRSEVGKRG